MKSFNSSGTKYSNNRIVIMLVTVVFLMLGLAYASVPLYDLFCRVTGFGGTPSVSLEKSEYSINQNINIRLDANVTNLNWDFSPEKNVYKIKIGENKVINYLAQNLSNEKQVGTALFNVTPEQAGQYFTKIECFCFHDLMLEPGEEILSKQVLTISGLNSGGVVNAKDLNSKDNDKRFSVVSEIDDLGSQTSLVADEDGKIKFRVNFKDDEPSIDGADYEALMKLGTASVYVT